MRASMDNANMCQINGMCIVLYFSHIAYVLLKQPKNIYNESICKTI